MISIPSGRLILASTCTSKNIIGAHKEFFGGMRCDVDSKRRM